MEEVALESALTIYLVIFSVFKNNFKENYKYNSVLLDILKEIFLFGFHIIIIYQWSKQGSMSPLPLYYVHIFWK